MIKSYCKANGLDLAVCFCDDGVSAHELKKAELNKLFEVLERGDVVVIKDRSRLARNHQKHEMLVNRLLDMGVGLVFVNEEEKEDNDLAIANWLENRMKQLNCK